MIRKRFDPELYAQNDEMAKKAVRRIFRGSGLSIKPHVKKRDVDLQVFDGKEHLFNVETEIKRVWKPGEDFKYENVQFPARKEKFCKLDKPTYFIMFNRDTSEYLVVPDKVMLKSPKVEVPNRFCPQGEYFFQVPLKKVIFNSVDKILEKL
jgi:hypothetical protein